MPPRQAWPGRRQQPAPRVRRPTSRVNQGLELGKLLGVSGTPTLFINGRKIANVNGTPYELLKAIADYEASQVK